MRALAACLLLGCAGCASAVESSKLEDRARHEVPVPICLKPMERRGDPGAVSVLKPQDYWATVLPSYDAAQATLDLSAPDCAGRSVLSSPELFGAEGPTSGTVPMDAKAAVINPAPDKLRIVWFRTHRFGEDAGGPLAVMRSREGHAEVYAIGVYRGHRQKSRFSLERMGSRMLVTASNEGCIDIKPGRSCETELTVYLMSAGRLLAATRFAVDRVEYGSDPQSGAVEYRMKASPVFEDGAIRLVEQLIVRDSAQTQLRKANLDRVFRLKGNAQLAPDRDSLWTQVVGKPAKAAPIPSGEPPSTPQNR